MLDSTAGEAVHWFGGWRPRSGVAIGIGFAADPLGAGLAVLASGLTLAALLYSLTYMQSAERQYDVLVSAFGGAMCGFALTADLFNMFVWFELMGVAAYALAGFKIRELRTRTPPRPRRCACCSAASWSSSGSSEPRGATGRSSTRRSARTKSRSGTSWSRWDC
jgi:NADH:ubiquinone oxidoreductase subunit 5 (subunit L)/multisubunit Na+/H+ antiporter MnhA subunit